MNSIDREGVKHAVSFMANWWHKNCGISFDEDYYFNADRRYEIERKMEGFLYERFGDIGLGNKEGNITLGMDFALPAALGCKVKFYSDMHPWIEPLNLNEKEIDALVVPDFGTVYPSKNIVEQVKRIEEKFGTSPGLWLDHWGLQNLAFKIRGERLLTDYYEDPELAKKVLKFCAEAIYSFATFANVLKKEQANSYLSNAHCSISLISPKIYAKFILPYDKDLASKFLTTGIHQDEAVRDIIDYYAQIPNLTILQARDDSDWERIRKVFPDIAVSILYYQDRLRDNKPDKIESEINEIIKRVKYPLKKMEIALTNIEYGVPDENIRAACRAIANYKDA